MEIPVFYPGEKCHFHTRPYELRCPACGHQFGSEDMGKTLEITVLCPANTKTGAICSMCKKLIFLPMEGFYNCLIQGREGWWALPYHLIERITDKEEMSEKQGG